MKRLFLVLLSCALATAVMADSALDPAKTIEADGSITLTDGSSYYTFSKGGTFTSGPLGLSGRALDGQWTVAASNGSEKFTVIATATWMNGVSQMDDYRRIVFSIGPGEKRPFRDHMVPAITEFAAYFLIDEFVKIPKPPSTGGVLK